jgi:RHS repeat-associated protein
LVSLVSNQVDSAVVSSYQYGYDTLARATNRNDDTFGYNARSEVTAAAILSNAYAYAYDGIGNALWSTNNGVGTAFWTNPLNQYTNILCVSAPLREPSYDLDGNMLTNGVWSYTYDAENRLTVAYSNSLCVVSNAYDYMGRRVLKVTTEAVHTFVYDGWNLVQELTHTQTHTLTNFYVWGKDLSGTMQGAGGVGGLLAVSINGQYFFPFQDANGNITAYVDESGTVVAEYTYDTFGATIAQSGPMAEAFLYRFSTKYHDPETGLYYYGYRFYSPELHRWLNRDPIDELGGQNLYAFCANNGMGNLDPFGTETIEAQGMAAGWAGTHMTLQGKTLIQLSGESFYFSGAPQTGMKIPKSGSTSVLFIYKPDNPNQIFRVDFHRMRGTGEHKKWHYNTTPALQEIREISVTNHKIARGAAATGKTVTIFKWGGRAMFLSGIAASGYEIYHAENKPREITRQIGGWGAAVVGGRVGASAGIKTGAYLAVVGGQAGPQAAAPEEIVVVPLAATIGGIIGGIGGGIAGWWAGTTVSETVYDWTFESLAKEEWKIYCEKEVGHE